MSGRAEVTVLEDKEAERAMVFSGDGGDEVEIAHMGNYFAQVVKVRTRACRGICSCVVMCVCVCIPCVCARARVNARTRRTRRVENMRLCSKTGHFFVEVFFSLRHRYFLYFVSASAL